MSRRSSFSSVRWGGPLFVCVDEFSDRITSNPANNFQHTAGHNPFDGLLELLVLTGSVELKQDEPDCMLVLLVNFVRHVEPWHRLADPFLYSLGYWRRI